MYMKWNPLIVAAAIAIPLSGFAQESGAPVVPEQVFISYHIFHVESPAENITGISLEREEIKEIAADKGIKGVAEALKKEGETKLLQSGNANGLVGAELRHRVQTERAVGSHRTTTDESNRGNSSSSFPVLSESITSGFIAEAPNGNHELRYTFDLDIVPPLERNGTVLYSRLRTTLSNTTRIANAEKETIVVRTSHTLGEKPVDLIYIITAELKPSN